MVLGFTHKYENIRSAFRSANNACYSLHIRQIQFYTKIILNNFPLAHNRHCRLNSYLETHMHELKIK